MGKILSSAKEIERYLGMSIQFAIEHGFPIAKIGSRPFVRANTDDLDAHISRIAREQQEGTTDKGAAFRFNVAPKE